MAAPSAPKLMPVNRPLKLALALVAKVVSSTDSRGAELSAGFTLMLGPSSNTVTVKLVVPTLPMLSVAVTPTCISSGSLSVVGLSWVKALS